MRKRSELGQHDILSTILAVLLVVTVWALPSLGEVNDESPVGVLEPIEVSHSFEVPRDGLRCLPQASFVCPESLCVRDKDGRRLESVTGEPGPNQYRLRLDGCIRFAPADRGKRFTARYQYRPRRVAILPAIIGTDYEDAEPTLLETLRGQLETRGFVFASADDVSDALVQTSDVEGGDSRSGDRLGASALRSLAESLDAAYLILPGADASEDAVVAGFQTHTWVSGSGRSAHSTSIATERHYMDAAAGLRVFAGSSGELVFDDMVAGSKRVRFRQFGPARRDLIRDLARQLVVRWRGEIGG